MTTRRGSVLVTRPGYPGGLPAAGQVGWAVASRVGGTAYAVVSNTTVRKDMWVQIPHPARSAVAHRRRYAGATSLMASPMRWMRSAFVDPGMPGGEPAMITTWSPCWTRPISSRASSTCRTISSVCSTSCVRNVSTPQLIDSCERTLPIGVKASTGTLPRYRDSRRAESPDCVNATRYDAPTRSATSAAALAMTPPRVFGCQSMAAILASSWASVEATIRAIVSTVSIGYSPTLVSPDSITASAPSSTAFATSDASARVGAGLLIIDSSIWVATITGLALRRGLSVNPLFREGAASGGHSPPRAPRGDPNAAKAPTPPPGVLIAPGFSLFPN